MHLSPTRSVPPPSLSTVSNTEASLVKQLREEGEKKEQGRNEPSGNSRLFAALGHLPYHTSEETK